MKIDVFISYEHNSKSIADSIVSSFERDKIRCWYAPRDVIGDYATSIVDAIENASVFVLILNGESSNSPHVLNEVEMAYMKNIEQSQTITIVPFKVANAEFSRAMEYYIKRIHWIDATTSTLESAIGDLKAKVKKILGINDEEIPAPEIVERTENKYFKAENKKELKRLHTQVEILKKFDGFVYDGISSTYPSLKVLDLGSNCGDGFAGHFGHLPNLYKAVGIEYDEASVERANATYGSDVFKFYCGDVEADDFSEKLEDICEKEGIDKFDIVCISMLILHLKNPFNLLKKVRKHLASGGSIIVCDIDDGFNIGYPDKDNIFSETVRMLSESEISGYRKSGREIYTMLKDSGYNNIKLENFGLSTVGMNYDEREAFFNIYFGFMEGDMRYMAEKYPSSEKYKTYHEFIKNNYPRLESEFMREDFFFMIGFMLFTAKK